MTLESRDALAVYEEVREYLAYLRELGIENVESLPEDLRQPANKPESLSSFPTAPNTKATSGTPRKGFPPATESRRSERPGKSQDFLFGDFEPPEETGLPTSAETLESIWTDIGDCTRCPLCHSRTNVVNTHGNRKARLMFVGEAPGADEDAQSRPFVGRAGQLLTKIIEAMGLKRDEVLIGNVNRCRPPGNRQPTTEEAAVCKPFLLREIAVVRPEVIVVLGNSAMKNLLETREGITRLRGQFQEYHGIKVMPTFHPAYLLRDPSKKRETWEDMKRVREHLDNSPAKRDAP
ncbi:MAG TPA: uracil-DNA glycosylase [Pyrinomonadaceae bacterium]|jgi:DNA polymerase